MKSEPFGCLWIASERSYQTNNLSQGSSDTVTEFTKLHISKNILHCRLKILLIAEFIFTQMRNWLFGDINKAISLSYLINDYFILDVF